MKQKISITIDSVNIEKLEELLKEGFFRSKSHIIEFVVNKFLKEKENGKKINL